MKRQIYRSCTRSAMLYGSSTWCRRKNEMAILKRSEKAMIRAMCGVILIEKRSSQELINLLGLEKTLDGLASANEMRWYGRILRRGYDDVLKKMLDFKAIRRRGRKKGK